MGTLLYLEALKTIDPTRGRSALAIYSCGNAALAAAAVARAGGYELHAFVPADVDPLVAGLLAARGAVVEKIPRSGTGAGDPCYLAFQAAVSEKGWLPFACAGNDNWSNIEGGSTLGWELVLQMAERSETLEHVVIQVGGGALARAAAQALEEAHGLGLIARLPRIHVCQPAGGFPFVRAWLLALAEIARRNGHSLRFGLPAWCGPEEFSWKMHWPLPAMGADQIQAIADFVAAPFRLPGDTIRPDPKWPAKPAVSCGPGTVRRRTAWRTAFWTT